MEFVRFAVSIFKDQAKCLIQRVKTLNYGRILSLNKRDLGGGERRLPAVKLMNSRNYYVL